jgi:hypothetical protein
MSRTCLHSSGHVALHRLELFLGEIAGCVAAAKDLHGASRASLAPPWVFIHWTATIAPAITSTQNDSMVIHPAAIQPQPPPYP